MRWVFGAPHAYGVPWPTTSSVTDAVDKWGVETSPAASASACVGLGVPGDDHDASAASMVSFSRSACRASRLGFVSLTTSARWVTL